MVDSIEKTNVCRQGSRSPKFGAEIRPPSQRQKYVFFPILDEKFPNLIKYVLFGSEKISGVVVKYIENHLKLKK